MLTFELRESQTCIVTVFRTYLIGGVAIFLLLLERILRKRSTLVTYFVELLRIFDYELFLENCIIIPQ